MSSTYRILCLSHDPAIVIAMDWESGNDGRATAEHLAAHPEEHEATADHAGCDLLIGRYSYPLVEVGCPAATKPGKPTHYPFHPHSTRWIDIAWLRLLAVAQRAGGDVSSAASQVDGCWTAERLHRLRNELGTIMQAGGNSKGGADTGAPTGDGQGQATVPPDDRTCNHRGINLRCDECQRRLHDAS